MKNRFLTNLLLVQLLIFVFSVSLGVADEKQGYIQASPTHLSANQNLPARLLGKTMQLISHKDSIRLPQIAQAKKVQPQVTAKLFDPQRKESPIRTARLFKIKIQTSREVVAMPVATVVEKEVSAETESNR